MSSPLRPVPDHSTLLFKGNGAGLSGSVLALANVIPTQNFAFSIGPSAIYFLGVLLAFGVHAVSSIINGDIERRQRHRDAVEQIAELQESEHFTDDLIPMVSGIQADIEEQRKTLLTIEGVRALERRNAAMYAGSAICFAVATTWALGILATA